jgi:hypothetical protein
MRWAQTSTGQNRVRAKGAKRKRISIFFENTQTIEFKPGFEFKHFKTMHRHVCNNKLLYFIIKLRKMVKCLEKHNLLIFLK